MDLIKRKIYLESGIDRNNYSETWGQLTATTFYVKIFISQNIDNMGLFTDMQFVEKNNIKPDYTLLTDKLNSLGVIFPFMTGATVENIIKIDNNDVRVPGKNKSYYYKFGNKVINGSTDSKIEELKSYDEKDPYKIGFNINTERYYNYKNILINGVDKVISNDEPKVYVFNTPDDENLGTDNQKYGLQYKDYTGLTKNVIINNIEKTIPLTTFRFIGEGENETNISLSALTKEEYLMGVVSPPSVQSDVFVDRGQTSVMDKHLRLSEIRNLSDLVNYGNGFYNINK